VNKLRLVLAYRYEVVVVEEVKSHIRSLWEYQDATRNAQPIGHQCSQAASPDHSPDHGPAVRSVRLWF